MTFAKKGTFPHREELGEYLRQTSRQEDPQWQAETGRRLDDCLLGEGHGAHELLALHDRLAAGIGSAKAFGFGLLVLAPISTPDYLFVFVMRANPEPTECAVVYPTEHTPVPIDSRGPIISHLFEMETRVTRRVFLEPEGPLCLGPVLGGSAA